MAVIDSYVSVRMHFDVSTCSPVVQHWREMQLVGGHLFEQFFVLECVKLNQYLERGYRFSYLTTKAGAEIDLIIERPGEAPVLIEVKSSLMQQTVHARHLAGFRDDFPACLMMVVSQDETRRLEGNILHLHWRDALIEVFGAMPGA